MFGLKGSMFLGVFKGAFVRVHGMDGICRNGAGRFGRIWFGGSSPVV